MDFHAVSGELVLPFSDAVKYSILGMSLTLLLLTLGILAWEVVRCCKRNAAYTQPEDVNNEPLFLDDKATTARDYCGSPSIKLDTVGLEVGRLSRCLFQSSFPSLDTSEPANMKVNGSLRFAIYYDRQQRHLVVTVLEAEGLQEQSPTRSLKPFVKLRLIRVEVDNCMDEKDGGTPLGLSTVLHEWQTHVVKGSCNPLFGDQFSCILQDHKELRRIILRMEMRDFDKFSRDTLLGEVRFPLRQINSPYPLEIQQELRTPQKDLVGEVLLSLKFLPTSQRLEVGLLKVTTVQTVTCSDAVVYARITVHCNQCKLRCQKTSAVERGFLMVFNEVFIFSLPEFPLEKCKVLVSFYETHKPGKSPKRLFGTLTVRKEDAHWDLMMCSVRQPTAQWHGLFI